MAQPSVYEQFMLEMVNRARLNPQAEADLLGIGLNDGIKASDTISSDPKQPLAFNSLLIDSSRSHSQWMLDTDTFSHKGVNDTGSNQRMRDAGYQFTGSWTSGENIAYKGTTGTVNVAVFTEDIHENLFKSSGHRKNILKTDFREIGIATTTGEFDGFNALMVTQNFAKSGSDVFLTGVAYDDLVIDDDFYTVGEELAEIDVTAIDTTTRTSYTTATMDAGGYQLALPSGTYDVSFSDNNQNLGTSSQITINSENIKLDLDTSNIITTVFTGTSGDDSIEGSIYDDTLNSGLGNDTLDGNDGNDKLYGRGGNDSLMGGDGDDSLSGLDGADTLLGGNGADTLLGGNNNDLLKGGLGNNILKGGSGVDTIFGGNDHDLLKGESGNDILNGGLGDDTLDGGDGNDKLYGKTGNDSLVGGDGDDSLSGLDGADTLLGGNGADTLSGGNNNDLLKGGLGNNVLKGGSGVDTLYGGNDHDLLQGESGNDILNSGLGDDTVIGGSGNDKLYGKTGNDSLQGDSGNDLLSGLDGSDILSGGKGIDTLSGGDGDDVLKGREGDDILSGNSGSDIFVIESLTGTDTIADFHDGADMFGLTAALGFSDLSITDSSGNAVIMDTTNNDQILAIVNNVSAVDLSEDDFMTI